MNSQTIPAAKRASSDRRWRLSVLAACAALAACGGGGSSGPAAADSQGRATAFSVPAPTGSDEVLNIAQVGDAAANKIYVRRPYNCLGFTCYTKLTGLPGMNSSGELVLDDLPAALAGYKRKITTGHLRIQFKSGTYRMTRGWAWSETTSGTAADHQLILERMPGTAMGDVVIAGSKAYSASVSGNDATATIPAALSFSQLWAEGQRATRARTPNAGKFFYVTGQKVQAWNGTVTLTEPITEAYPYGTVPIAAHALSLMPGDAAEVAKASNTAGALLVAAHTWTIGMHRIDSVDTANYRAKVSPALNVPFSEYGEGQRYFLENYPAALDSAGEWYVPPTGAANRTLHYWPRGSGSSTVGLEVPVVRQLLTMSTSDIAKHVRFVTFSGLAFRYASSPIADTGYSEDQAAHKVEAALRISNAQNVVFDGCEVSHTGGYGMWLDRRATSVTVRDTEIYDTGAGGIKVGPAQSTWASGTAPLGLTAADVDELNSNDATGSNTIDHNHIHAIGYVYPGAVGVWVGRSSNNKITNNLIEDTTYTAISLGWDWGSGASANVNGSMVQLSARNNTVQGNFLVDIGQHSMSDLGGIYTLGRSTNTVIRDNVIKNVTAYGRYGGFPAASGLYADQGSSDITFQSNVVAGADWAGFTQNYGVNNTVAGNVLANMPWIFSVSQLDFAWVNGSQVPSTVMQVSASGNAFFPQKNDFIGLGNREPSRNPALDVTTGSGDTAAWRPMPDGSGLYVQLGAGNRVSSQFLPSGTSLLVPNLCTACAASPALTLRLGTDRLDLPSLSDGSVVANAASWKGVTVPAGTAVGTSPSKLWAASDADVPPTFINFNADLLPEGFAGPLPFSPAVETLKTTADKSGAGLCASPANSTAAYVEQNVFVNYAQGKTATATATVRVLPDTEFVWEWRDSTNTPIKSGPMLRLVGRAGAVEVSRYEGGIAKPITTLAATGDVTLKVSTLVAPGATWSLDVSVAGGATSSFTGLGHASADWNKAGVFSLRSGQGAGSMCIKRLMASAR